MCVQIDVYQPNGSRGIPVSEVPPLEPPSGVNVKHYEYGKLPQKYVKKYKYASRSVDMDIIEV